MRDLHEYTVFITQFFLQPPGLLIQLTTDVIPASNIKSVVNSGTNHGTYFPLEGCVCVCVCAYVHAYKHTQIILDKLRIIPDSIKRKPDK